MNPLTRLLQKCRKAWRAHRSLPHWASLRNIHRGRRGFVIGNGPSLGIADLDRLQGEITLASNKIYLAFGETLWRPSYYTVCDDVLWGKICNVVASHFPSLSTPWDFALQSGILHRHFRQLSWSVEDSSDGRAFSLDVSRGLFGGFTVTYTNLQIAAHMGLNPIYLVGCDHHYVGETGQRGDLVPVAEGQNHFHAGYRRIGEQVNPAPIAKMEQAFAHARAVHDQGAIQIYNATCGGRLEIFERVDFDSLL